MKTPIKPRGLIVDRDTPVLRKIAKEVSVKEIGSKKIQNIIKKMQLALHREEDGVAIAAPQIGESLRIFVVNGGALDLLNKPTPHEHTEEESKAHHEPEDLIFINPEFVKLSKKKKDMEEGCLSVRWLYGRVKRSEKATIRAYDKDGEKVRNGASGLLAQIFQHEIDHLDGILFIDKAEDLKEIPPTKKM